MNNITDKIRIIIIKTIKNKNSLFEQTNKNYY
jgi:hypothetical protein